LEVHCRFFAADEFSVVRGEVTVLGRMLADGVSNKYAPRDIYDVMSKIVNSEDNTIRSQVIYTALGREKVEAMISDGVVFYHPGSDLGNSDSMDVLMPTSVPALRALEILLERYSYLQRNPLGNLVPSHLQDMVLCDVSKTRAHAYFLSLVKNIPEDIQTLLGKDIESFETVFHITGGRKYFIKRYVNDVEYEKKLIPGPFGYHY
jgi:hypothetical protein